MGGCRADPDVPVVEPTLPPSPSSPWTVSYDVDPAPPVVVGAGAGGDIVTARTEIRSLFVGHAGAAEAVLGGGGRSARVALADYAARAFAGAVVAATDDDGDDADYAEDEPIDGDVADEDEKKSDRDADVGAAAAGAGRRGRRYGIETLDRRYRCGAPIRNRDVDVNSASGRGGVGRRRGRRGNKRSRSTTTRRNPPLTPFMLERTDFWCDVTALWISFRLVRVVPATEEKDPSPCELDAKRRDGFVSRFLSRFTRSHLLAGGAGGGDDGCAAAPLLRHVACAVLQDRIRELIGGPAGVDGTDDGQSNHRGVSFVADGSVLPRKSGASFLPMSCPPAVPFASPPDSPMTTTLRIPLGRELAKHVAPTLPPSAVPSQSNDVDDRHEDDGIVTLTGLLVPRGVTLIVGGGYHGKSTLLRALAVGVYNKIPSDGRTYVITARDAVSVRSEDGRYVSNCNVAAFLSNLPNGDDTTKFSTGEASGSTSQAANVSEAIEAGASALLVDEDLSAANFMARDGRMRALVADESITPLLYRVNGMYDEVGVSSVVVVGGVGDWLDVPHNVLLLKNYKCYDATKKAKSVSATFSYGHVQYAGRGVVHRLKWEGGLTPKQRRPAASSSPAGFADCDGDGGNGQGALSAVSLVGGSDSRLLLTEGGGYDEEDDVDENPGGPLRMEGGHHGDDEEGEDDDDDDRGAIDMGRCEQLVVGRDGGGPHQLYGCGLCLSWLLRESSRRPRAGLAELLDRMDAAMDDDDDAGGGVGGGGVRSMMTLSSAVGGADRRPPRLSPAASADLLASVGFAYRPRRHEVAMALTRMRGLLLEDAPVDLDAAAIAEEAEERERERQRKILADLWNNRRGQRR